MWPLRTFTRITLYKCIWNRRLLAGSLCNSRIEESQGIKNKKIGNRRSAWSKQKNDLLSGSFPVANYRSTKGYSKYRNELRDSSDIGIVLLFTIYKKHLSNTNVIIKSLFLSSAAYYWDHMAAHFMQNRNVLKLLFYSTFINLYMWKPQNS